MEKFHPIWKLYEGTSFTKLHSGRKLWKIAQGARINGLSSYLVSMGALSILITLPICSSKEIRKKALPLQKCQRRQKLALDHVPNFELWNHDIRMEIVII